MKHVKFADMLGLDLELIHEIKLNSIEHLYPSHISKNFFSDKILIENFRLDPDCNYMKLINDGICLNSIEIFDQTSLRGIILTLNQNNYFETKRKKSNFLNFFNKKDEILVKELDIVYVIWSLDDWKTWKYQSTLQKNCKSLKSSTKALIKTHEFFIQDLEIDINENFQLIVCHQIGMDIFKDTNNEECYTFKCAIKL